MKNVQDESLDETVTRLLSPYLSQYSKSDQCSNLYNLMSIYEYFLTNHCNNTYASLCASSSQLVNSYNTLAKLTTTDLHNISILGLTKNVDEYIAKYNIYAGNHNTILAYVNTFIGKYNRFLNDFKDAVELIGVNSVIRLPYNYQEKFEKVELNLKELNLELFEEAKASFIIPIERSGAVASSSEVKDANSIEDTIRQLINQKMAGYELKSNLDSQMTQFRQYSSYFTQYISAFNNFQNNYANFLNYYNNLVENEKNSITFFNNCVVIFNNQLEMTRNLIVQTNSFLDVIPTLESKIKDDNNLLFQDTQKVASKHGVSMTFGQADLHFPSDDISTLKLKESMVSGDSEIDSSFIDSLKHSFNPIK